MASRLGTTHRHRVAGRWIILRREGDMYVLLDPWTLDLHFLNESKASVLALLHKFGDPYKVAQSMAGQNEPTANLIQSIARFAQECGAKKWI